MGSPWNLVSAQGSEETRMMGLPDGRKSFKIGLAVLIQYRRVADTQPRCHSLLPRNATRRAGKNFSDDLQFFGTFSVEPLVIYYCALHN